MEKRLKGFEPIVSENSRVLILGSMPSVVSLEKQEYYGFKHNRFWKIMGLYAGCRWESYEMKKRFILQEGFALWDVIDSCEREGSLDSKIKNIICSDIDGLLKQYPKIHTVILNGQKAASCYMRYFSHCPLRVRVLPSTSNANRTIKESELIEKWLNGLKEAFVLD